MKNLTLLIRNPTQLLPVLLGVLGVAVIGMVVWPMWQQNYPHTHSFHFNMMWAFQYGRQFWAGQLYPRWLEGSYFGLGSPTFSFYPPLCMMSTLPFVWLGTGKALVGSMALATVVRAWGSYWAARQVWSAPISVAVVIMAATTPYFVLDIYDRGAIAEVWGLSLMPWVIGAGLGLTRAILTGSRWWRWGLALAAAYGGLALTHLPMVLVWTVVWPLWPLGFAQSFSGPLKPRVWQPLMTLGIRIYGVTVLGLLSVSFFVLPAAFDQSLVSIDLINGWDIYDPLQRFMVSFTPWIQTTDHAYDQLLLPHFWLPLLVLGLTLMVAVLRLRLSPKPPEITHEITQDPDCIEPRIQRGLLFFVAGSLLIASLMMTSLSAPIYQLSGSLTRIQFPWRWMGVTASVVPFCFGYLWQGILGLESVLSPILKRPAQITGSLLILGLMGWIMAQGLAYPQQALYNPPLVAEFEHLMEQRPPFPAEPTIDPAQGERFLGWHWKYPEGLAFVDAFEYRPVLGQGSPVPPARTYPLLEWQSGQGQIETQTWRYGQRHFWVKPDPSSDPVVLTLRMFAYPAWQIKQDGRLLSPDQISAAPDGRLQLALDPTPTDIDIRYQGTPAEQWGNAISGIVILGLGILSLWEAGSHRQGLMALERETGQTGT